MKTIAHIYSRYSPSVILDLHNEISKRGNFSSVLLAEKYVPNAKPLFLNTYFFHRIPDGDVFQRIDRLISGNIAYKIMRKSFFERMLRTHQVSLLHAHFGMAGCAIMDLAKKHEIPLVVTFYGVDGSYCLKDKRWVPHFKKLFTIADRIVVLCDEVKHRVMAFGYPEEKIRLWNCLEDVDFYTYSKRPQAKPMRFIIAARFVEKKGYPLLLNAFAKFAKECPDARLTAIGYGEGKKNVLKICDELDIKDKVEVISTDNNPNFDSIYRERLSQSHIFILPSITAKNGDDEGGPALTLIAAQAAGLPVITTRFPGSERSVVDGLTGIYCDPDPDSIYDKMRYLYERPQMWDELGCRASEYVKKEFRVEDQVIKMEAIYNELV